jgi:cellulose synthase/poly-beta-1,6-N-acetylglucosamine synthase-like glycosyltransferase
MSEVLRGIRARPLIGTPASPGIRACVIIPVRDEAATLGATLRALAEQVDPEGRPLDRSSFEVIILASNCRDGSADLARRFWASEPALALHVVEVESGPISPTSARPGDS